LRVAISPELGGRILQILDKRTDTEVLGHAADLRPVGGGVRGARLACGIQLRLNREDRPNSMGSVPFLIEEADDEGPASAVVGEAGLAEDSSFTIRYSLPPDRAELTIEVRCFNRGFDALPYCPSLSVGRAGVILDGFVWFGDCGLAFESDSPFLHAKSSDECLEFLRFDANAQLAPRQLDVWSVTLAPITGVTNVIGASTSAAISSCPGRLVLFATRPLPGAKLLLRTEDGQLLETRVDLYPEAPLELGLAGLSSAPVEFILLSGGEEVLRVPSNRQPSSFAAPPISILDPGSEAHEIRQATFDVSRRHIAHLVLAQRAMAKKEWTEADYQLEQVLSFNAEDHLAWWAKAACRRVSEASDEETSAEESRELLNAHFLAPLDPILRAEAFLSQPTAMTKDPNPLVATLAENPESLCEVASILIEHGLLDQASRWIDEALRHENLATLHYVMAYILIAGTRMEAEAASHVVHARTAQLLPLPWRRTEIKALILLRDRFPKEQRISVLLDLFRVCG
jgi:hypothetical protein